MKLRDAGAGYLSETEHNQCQEYLKNNLSSLIPYMLAATEKVNYNNIELFLNECHKLLEAKFDITEDNNPTLYDAVMEMIIINCLDDYNPTDRYELQLASREVDEQQYCLGNMLAKLESDKDKTKALLAINEIMPVFSELIEQADKCPSFFIEYYEKTSKDIAFNKSFNKLIENSKSDVYQSRIQYVEHLLEEAIADGELVIRTSYIKEIAAMIVDYENSINEQGNEKLKLDKSAIKEIFSSLVK